MSEIRLIDANRLKECLFENFDGIQCYDGTGFDIYKEAAALVDEMPTIEDHSLEIARKCIELGRKYGNLEGKIEYKRPQGKWEEYACCNARGCSVCGYMDDWYFEHNFCPKCGAEMKGEDHGQAD